LLTLSTHGGPVEIIAYVLSQNIQQGLSYNNELLVFIGFPSVLVVIYYHYTMIVSQEHDGGNTLALLPFMINI